MDKAESRLGTTARKISTLPKPPTFSSTLRRRRTYPTEFIHQEPYQHKKWGGYCEESPDGPLDIEKDLDEQLKREHERVFIKTEERHVEKLNKLISTARNKQTFTQHRSTAQPVTMQTHGH